VNGTLKKNNKLGIDINTITYASNKKVYWKCSKNIHESYKTTPNHKTKKNGGTGCLGCFNDSRRVHNEEKLEILRNSNRNIINTSFIGDDTEIFVEKLLKESKKFKNVERIGQIGGSGDIVITDFNEKISYIQIKTLTHTNNDNYVTRGINKYQKDMLIVMINKERTRFALEFSGNIKVGYLTLSFGSKKSKYDNIMYKNINEFFIKMVDLIPLSSSINQINENIKKEKNMLNRLKKYCEENNKKFLRNDTNGDTIDGYINNKKIQAKFTSTNSSKSTFRVKFAKNAGLLNGKYINKSYEEGDFDYLIVEVGGTKEEKNKYEGNFCIIPSNILLEQKAFKNNDCKGKLAIYICLPDSKKDHWSKTFWNNMSDI